MARLEYQAGLDALEASLQEQGQVVLRAVRGAVDAMQAQDVELCDEVIAFDDEIDVRYHRIERSIEEILAQQAPVATDLRLVLAVLHNSIHLERIGDQSVTVAKLTKLSADLETRHDLVEGLGEMGDRAEHMVRVALDSFAARDVVRAQELVDLDELIDRTNRRVVDQVLQMARGAGPAGVGDADDRRRALHRADRRQRRRHRRADRVRRHGRVHGVHRCIPLRGHSFTQRKHRAGLPSRADPSRVCSPEIRRKGLDAMKKSLAAGLALVALVVATVVATGATAAPSKSQAGTLTGAGATFPFPLISKWIPEVGKAYDINITYSPTGSGAGIAAITARTVDFGASDAPLSSSQLDACKGCVVIPWALSATSIPYNLPSLNGRLRLTGPVLAQIYLGEITSWNDQRIRALNPGRNLPDTKITPVFRSDGSGTTYNFTEYLSSVSPMLEGQGRRQHERQLPDGRRVPAAAPASQASSGTLPAR